MIFDTDQMCLTTSLPLSLSPRCHLPPRHPGPLGWIRLKNPPPFEPAHGSVFDITGKGAANLVAAFLSAAEMHW